MQTMPWDFNWLIRALQSFVRVGAARGRSNWAYINYGRVEGLVVLEEPLPVPDAPGEPVPREPEEPEELVPVPLAPGV
jgi:hypothetical protein